MVKVEIEYTEVKKDKEWILYPKGQKPIRVFVDKRIHGEPTRRNIGRGRPKAFPDTRTVRLPEKGVSQTGVGHEVGHIILGHKSLVEEEQEITPRFIREELEAEYWAYDRGFPKRKYKIIDLRELALDIGMTWRQFDKMHRKVKRRLKGR